MLLLQAQLNLSFAQNISKQEMSSSTNLTNKETDDFKMHFNASNKSLIISSDYQSKYSIYTLKGQCINKGVQNSESETAIDLTWLKKGFYIVEVQYKRKLRRKKIIKR